MLTPAQRKACQEGLAQSNRSLLDVERLEQIAGSAPQYAEQVAALRTKRDALNALCSTVLEVDRNARGQ
jgi:hypothetical protein